MFKKALITLVAFISFEALSCSDLLNTDVKVLNEKEYRNLCEYKDKTILVVNTASKCGFTYQYEQLESLQRRFKDQDFVVLGFPSRNFMGQEYSDEAKVSEFCKAKFDVTFPLFSIANVSATTKHPFFKKLFKKTYARPAWNFHKYLITPNGEIKSFSHRMDPEDPEILAAIQDSINL